MKEGIEKKLIKIEEITTTIPSPFAFNLIAQGISDILKIEERVEFFYGLGINPRRRSQWQHSSSPTWSNGGLQPGRRSSCSGCYFMGQWGTWLQLYFSRDSYRFADSGAGQCIADTGTRRRAAIYYLFIQDAKETAQTRAGRPNTRHRHVSVIGSVCFNHYC